MRFENLNITGIDNCTSTQFENFHRDAAGPDWATATPSGAFWASGGAGSVTMAVSNSSTGGASSGGGIETHAINAIGYQIAPLPFDASSDFTCSFEFVFDQIFGAPIVVEYIVAFGGGNGSNTGVVMTLQTGASTVQVTTPDGASAQEAFGFVPGTTYLGEFSVGGDVAELRIWDRADLRPADPIASSSMGGEPLNGTDILILATQPPTPGNISVTWDSWMHLVDFDYDGRPCSSCSPVFDTFSSSPNVPFDCVTQDVEWASTGGSTLEAEVSQGAQIVGGDPLVIEFRANSSDGDYPSLLYAHEYSDDNRCDFNITAAVGGSLTPFVVLPTVAHVVGGTSVTTAGIEISTSGGSGADCSTSSFGISVSFSQLLSSYDALIPEPGHPDASYGAFGGNTTQTFFPSAFVDFMGVCGIALDADGPSQVYLGDSSVDFTISPSTTYNLSLEVEAGTGSLWVWDDSDPQPTEPTIQAAVSSSTFGVFVQQSLFSDDGFSVTLSNLSSQGSEPSTSDQAENGPALCQPFVGGVHGYTVSQPYVFASTRVYVDGTFQRRDIDYAEVDPAAGTIYFGVAPAPPATVTICFTPAVG